MALNTMGRGAGARRKALSCHGIYNARGYNSTYEDVPDMSRTFPDTVAGIDVTHVKEPNLRRKEEPDCSEYINFLLDQTPHFDREILKDWAPTDDAWIGHVCYESLEPLKPNWMPLEVWRAMIDFHADISGVPIEMPEALWFHRPARQFIKWLNPKRKYGKTTKIHRR
jgi:hypothetical protein